MSVGFPTSSDIYLEVDGTRVAVVQSYTARASKTSTAVEAFGESEPVATIEGQTKHVVELSRLYATDEAIHSGTVNYFLIYLGGAAVGYFALDLSTPGAVCLARLFLQEPARGRGIGRGVVSYAQKLAEGDGRTRLYLKVWAKDLKAADFCKRCRFRPAGTAPVEVLPGTVLDLTTWEKLWR